MKGEDVKEKPDTRNRSIGLVAKQFRVFATANAMAMKSSPQEGQFLHNARYANELQCLSLEVWMSGFP